MTTEAEDDGHHGVWFNRGVAGSQAFVKRFGQYTPPVDAGEDHPAFAWLSRGLGEAFRAFVDRAVDGEWGLRGAFYEFTWATGLDALAAAVGRGADVALVVHGRDSDSATGPDRDTTAADSRSAVTAAGLDDVVTWRTAANKGALQHNKFLVLTHAGAPVAVWTGSTNVTQGAVFGHLNVGHSIGDPAVAAQFLAYWDQLVDQTHTTATLRTWTEQHDPVDLTSPPPAGLTTIFSPRARSSTLLPWYAAALAAATSSAHVTGAFGLHKVFRDELGIDRDIVRTVLLDRQPAADEPIPTTDPDVRISWGDELHHDLFDVWAQEHLTDFNKWVKFIHTKILLVDPLTDAPTVITGSANYSDSSTIDNEESSIVIRAAAADGDGAAVVRRVADIYVTEYHRLFTHFVFRDRAERLATDPSAGRLVEDDSWSSPYYEAGSWRARQRRDVRGHPAVAAACEVSAATPPACRSCHGSTRIPGRCVTSSEAVSDVVGRAARWLGPTGATAVHQRRGAWRSAATASGSPSRSTRAWSWRPKANSSSSPGGPVTVTTGVRSPTVRLAPSGRRRMTPTGARPNARPANQPSTRHRSSSSCATRSRGAHPARARRTSS